MAQAKVQPKDNTFAYITAAVVICLAAIFLFTWTQMRAAHDKNKPHVAYAKFGPYQIETQSFALNATLVVQTSTDDASWPDRNRKDLDVVFKRVLADADPKTIRSPSNLGNLQRAMTKTCETTFGSHVVQAVLLTDFAYEVRDEQG